MRSALILAGGSGSRLGYDKSLLDLCGKPLIRQSVDKLLRLADEVVVSVRSPHQAEVLKKIIPEASFACDQVSGFGPVAGLAAGLGVSRGQYTLAVGCDLPFLNPRVIEALFDLAAGWDAAVPQRENGVLETMHSVYRTERMSEACLRSIEQGGRKIRSPLAELRINLVPERDLRPLDPDLLTFFNINTRDDLAQAERLLGCLL